MWLTKHGHARLNGGEETFPCKTKTKELPDSSVCFNFLMLPPPPLQYFCCLYWKHRPALGELGAGVPTGCVRSVSSHRGSSSHLPPYSSQPDPYPQPSPAQQARCLIPSKRLPAVGGVVGETKAGRSCGSWGAPQRGLLTRSLARRGRRPRQTAPCLLPASSSSSFISHTDPRG